MNLLSETSFFANNLKMKLLRIKISKLVFDSLCLLIYNLHSTKLPRAAFPPFLTTPTSQDCGINNFHVAYTTPET